MTTHDSFPEVLVSAGRSPEIEPADDVYGWLIGSWELTARYFDEQGNPRDSNGEVHFSWALEGRAVQDVWISPRRTERGAMLPGIGNLYGTTLRVYDRSLRAWRVNWFNPVTGARDELIGRRQGEDIVQDGKSADGGRIRWSFTDIASDSFRWLGERLASDGATWRLQAEFHANRKK